MAWTAPMTAVANTAFTAAQFNTYVRDNFLETAVAKATTSGSIFTGVGLNSIAERIPDQAVVEDAETTSSTSYTDLATNGPAVTVTTGAKALVLFGCDLNRTSSSSTASVRMSFAVSGATTVAATDNKGIAALGIWSAGTQHVNVSGAWLQTGLNPGSNTFTAKYRVSSGTGTFQSRNLLVIPF